MLQRPREAGAGAGAAEELRRAVEEILPTLRAISEAESARPRAPGKWSPREVLGHLIDSASNNHQRFVRAQFQEDLVFPGYEQDEWVRAQRYADAPWVELLELWRLYNRHLARVMEAIPDEVRLRKTSRHNFHRIAHEKVPEGRPARLDDLMHDYVVHLRHHLRQIAPETR
jgi:hypothetical protein